MENSVSEKVAKKINLYDTFCACGPYDIGLITRSFLDNSSGKPLWLASLLVCGAYYSHPAEFRSYSIQDFFCEKFNNARAEYDGGTYSLIEMTDKLLEDDNPTNIEIYESLGITTIQDVFSPDFFKEDGSVDYDCPLLKLMLEVMDNGHVTGGWTPKTKMMLMHSVNDVLAGYDAFTVSYDNLKYGESGASNPNVSKWLDYVFDHDILSGIGIVCAMLMEDPASDKLMDLYTKFDLSFLK